MSYNPEVRLKRPKLTQGHDAYDHEGESTEPDQFPVDLKVEADAKRDRKTGEAIYEPDTEEEIREMGRRENIRNSPVNSLDDDE